MKRSVSAGDRSQHAFARLSDKMQPLAGVRVLDGDPCCSTRYVHFLCQPWVLLTPVVDR